MSCDCSQIYAVIDRADVNDVDSAHHSIEHVAHAVVSAAGFLFGCSYSTEIAQVINDSDQTCFYGVQDLDVAFKESNEQLTQKFNELTELVRKDIYLRFAISDYTTAITDHVGGPMLCYRALESLAKSLGNTGIDDTDWRPMHKALGTTKDTIVNMVGQYAAPVRHGNWIEVGSDRDQRRAMLLFTRDVLAKYIEYSRNMAES
ncbi:hypothetical protein M2401_006207 [Pseudomonas sp. JUb42]|uniref:hypothetical protein n=1 Tax=Pseudomonas sp. JUb42 TaxID=2940611 RepID=UPI0021690A49|nr:hypothetical protein [Pseudomonas sp. JUb42]MCS3472443.1 hypothetical protein [Pseudomonas sp. JUb42]